MEWPPHPCGPSGYFTSHSHKRSTHCDATRLSDKQWAHVEVHHGPYLPNVEVSVPVSPMQGETLLVSKSQHPLIRGCPQADLLAWLSIGNPSCASIVALSHVR